MKLKALNSRTRRYQPKRLLSLFAIIGLEIQFALHAHELLNMLRINILRGTRREQSEISGGCFISRESWKRSRGKTRSADTCHEHRWSSPSLTSHFQPISRISSTFRVVPAIARFHAPSGRDWNWRSSWRQNKTKIRAIAFNRGVYCQVARMPRAHLW